jgi:hypothetical protein
MNGHIRFAHKLDLSHLVITSFLISRKDFELAESSFSKRWESATAELNSETKTKLNEYRAKLDFLAVQYVIQGSPYMILALAFPVVIFSLVVTVLKHSSQAIKKIFYSGPLDNIQSTAMAYGSE